MTTSIDAFPLIPRDHLFGNPTRAAGQISPDGKWLSWLAPRDGVLNIWMAPSADPEAARPMSNDTERPIREYFWAPDSRSLLYIQDKGGDENFLLYGIDVGTGKETTLTPFENTRVMLVGASDTHKDKLLVGLNNRDARFHDVHLLDLNTGALTLVLENNAYAGFMADDDLQLRIAILPNAEGGTDYFKVVGTAVETEPFKSTALDDALTTAPAGFTRDGKTMYWLDSDGRDTAALFAMDWATGTMTLVAEDPRADIGGTLRDQQTGEVLAWSATYLKREWTALDPEIGQAFAFLREQMQGEIAIASRTDDDRKWIVANDPVFQPAASYLYDRDAGTLTRLYVSRPELADAPLRPMHMLELKSRDGLTLPSYLTLPPGTDSTGDGVPDTPVPMVLLVHGGPWARDGYGFNGYHQWLANRGYAVLSVNYRGSTGFGKSFVNAANLQWGRQMHDDLIDAVEWAVGAGIAPRDKIAIMGGSYGGYATLAGLTFTPEVFACGVDIVGPSNLETLLESIPPYWEPLVAQFHTRMGNPNTPEGLALLKERSPLYKAGEIVRPLLIAQGANDPRVKQAESDQIVAAMKDAGVPVTYLLYPDEGHGFAKPANNIAFTAVTESFLATNLGGRAEPIGKTLAVSTAQIVDGAEFVEGLAASLERA
ncbi:S9 family peptidase [Parerythrobacter aurantius]|uniref:S9 family peptidase n=1 Tax=Parerythrobacter aurantius TaxID=3127706 RepID=UPI00325049E3